MAQGTQGTSTIARQSPFNFTRGERYRVIVRTLPYVYSQAIRKSFRTSQVARSSTAKLVNPEFDRVVHDIYCSMFVRGYRQVTGHSVDRATGLAIVLFTVFIYTFDDEFEKRIESAADTSAEAIINAPEVAAFWQAMGSYLSATGRSDEVREHIMQSFFAVGFDDYRENLGSVRSEGNFNDTKQLVEFDSGGALDTVYHIIRLYNRHPFSQECATEFYNLGMAGKFLDDLSDYTHDVRSGSPNLLHALVGETPSERAAAAAALAAGQTITLQWWQAHGAVTLARYLDMTYGYYNQVKAPALRLPLDCFLVLLGTRKFWTISTVRASRQHT
jgi:hypothetical protein